MAQGRYQAFVEVNAMGEDVLYYNLARIVWPMCNVLISKTYEPPENRENEAAAAMRRELLPEWIPAISRSTDPKLHGRLFYYKKGVKASSNW